MRWPWSTLCRGAAWILLSDPGLAPLMSVGGGNAVMRLICCIKTVPEDLDALNTRYRESREENANMNQRVWQRSLGA